MRLKEFFKRTERGYWFGNGRFLGFQIGSLDQRLSDPYYGDDKIIRKYWMPGSHSSFSLSEVSRITEVFVAKVNSGSASKNLVPMLNQFHSPDMQSEIENPLSIFHLYHEILDRSSTLESIPYLLQALESIQSTVEEEPFKKDPEMLEYENVIETGTVHHEWGYKYAWDTEENFDVKYAVRSTTWHYKVNSPFGELAKLKLLTIMEKVEDKQLRYKIKSAVERFDFLKPKTKQQKVILKREEVETTST